MKQLKTKLNISQELKLGKSSMELAKIHDFIQKCYNRVRKSEELLRKLINTTNSHSQLVRSQLESTDATLVEVYSAGTQM